MMVLFRQRALFRAGKVAPMPGRPNEIFSLETQHQQVQGPTLLNFEALNSLFSLHLTGKGAYSRNGFAQSD